MTKGRPPINTPERHIETLTDTDLQVCQLLADHFEVRLTDMFSMSRKRTCVYARHLFCRWQRKNTMRSLTDIGKHVRLLPIDHTTAIHSIQTADDLISTDSDVRQIWDHIKHIKPPVIMPEFKHDFGWCRTKAENRHLMLITL